LEVFVKKTEGDFSKRCVLHVQTKVLKLAQISSYPSTYYSVWYHLVNGTAQTLAEQVNEKKIFIIVTNHLIL